MSYAVIETPAARKVTALNPMGFPPKITRKTAAPRPETLDGKTGAQLVIEVEPGESRGIPCTSVGYKRKFRLP